MDLRNWLKTTLLIPPSTKEKLLKLKEWSAQIEQILTNIYEKYAKKEQEILKQVHLNKERWYIESLKNIEKLYHQKEQKDFKALEEKIKSL